MFCRNCGKQNPEKADYCHFCGNSLISKDYRLSSEQEDLHALYVKGLDLIKQQKFAEAIEKLDTIIKKDPNHASTWNAKAVVLDKLGDREQALISVENALRIRPNDPKFLDNWHKLKKKVDIAFNEKNPTFQKEKNRCGYCNTVLGMPFTCSYCGGNFCADHRLPFKHNCKNIDEWKFGKKKKQSTKKTFFNQHKNQHHAKRKNPLLAAILSIIYPGLGQIYTNQYFKAIVLWFIEIAGVFLAFIPTILGIIYGSYDAYKKASKMNQGSTAAKKINYSKAIGTIIAPFIIVILISGIINAIPLIFNSDPFNSFFSNPSTAYNNQQAISTPIVTPIITTPTFIPMNTFKSDAYGFSMKYPSAWVNQDINNINDLPGKMFYSPVIPKNNQLFTVQWDYNNRNEMLQNYYLRNFAGIDAKYHPEMTRPDAFLKINGNSAYRIDYGIKDDNGDVNRKDIKVFFQNGDYFIILTYSATLDIYNSNLETSQNMIQSVTLFEPSYSNSELRTLNIEQTPAVSDISDPLEKVIFTNTNTERQKKGLKPLIYDSKLSEIARSHSNDMIARQFFGHVNPSGEDPTVRATRYGYPTRKDMGIYYQVGIGENIGKMPIGNVVGIGYLSNNADDVGAAIVQAWMDSPGHRQNILSDEYDKIGVGVAFDGTTDYYATQDFW